jgi:hypothetical protein
VVHCLLLGFNNDIWQSVCQLGPHILVLQSMADGLVCGGGS